MKVKLKSKTKKILVLSVMVVLLVTTGVLNFVLSNKLGTPTNEPAIQGNVTQTFFAAARSKREATRESEFLYLDAIVNSENSSESAKKDAEAQKNDLIKRMEQELALETQIQGKGFDDAIVSIGDGGVSVVVGKSELTREESNQILAIVVGNTNYSAKQVKVMSYE